MPIVTAATNAAERMILFITIEQPFLSLRSSDRSCSVALLNQVHQLSADGTSQPACQRLARLAKKAFFPHLLWFSRAHQSPAPTITEINCTYRDVKVITPNNAWRAAAADLNLLPKHITP